MTEEKRLIHIRREDSFWYTLCGAPPNSSYSWLHYKFAMDNPETAIGEQVARTPDSLCQECKKLYEVNTAQ